MPTELDVHGVFNFRDLASAAPTLRRDMVYRSDGLHRTDAAGADTIARLGIRRVVDLRSVAEQEREGMFEHGEVETISAPLVADSNEIGRQLNAGGDDPLLDHYRSMLAGSPTEIARALGIVAESIRDARPVVFHCTAGKDRTGLLAALVLGLCGIDDASIVDDFHASTDGVERMSQWYEQERGETHTEKAKQMGIDPAIAHHMMRADRSTMEATLGALRTDHGGATAYAEAIGVPAEQLLLIARLQERSADER